LAGLAFAVGATGAVAMFPGAGGTTTQGQAPKAAAAVRDAKPVAIAEFAGDPKARAWTDPVRTKPAAIGPDAAKAVAVWTTGLVADGGPDAAGVGAEASPAKEVAATGPTRKRVASRKGRHGHAVVASRGQGKGRLARTRHRAGGVEYASAVDGMTDGGGRQDPREWPDAITGRPGPTVGWPGDPIGRR
jgi:hypothetical protein